MSALDAELTNGGSLPLQGATDPTERLLDRPWVAIAVRALGLVALMAGLAVVGAISILSGVQQGDLLDQSAVTRADLAGGWLAVTRATGGTPQSASATPSAAPSERPAAPTSPSAAPSASPPSGEAPAASPGITPDGKVVLNRATAEELTRLPGVGEKRAAAIIALRERLKRFKRPSDLLQVRGIGPASLAKMKPYFVLDAPTADTDDQKRDR